jgi:glucokinase
MPAPVGLAAGIDMGGTKCLGVVLDGEGSVVREERRPTPSGPEAVVATLAELADDLRPWDTLGVGAAGLVTLDGVVRAGPHLHGVRDLPLGARLSARLGQPVVVDNDATATLVAEWRHGAAMGARDAVLVTLGTGIGGGIVAGGRLQRGAHGFAGEPGHMVVDPDGPPCPCGRRGCWERYASGTGLARMGREAAEGGRLGALTEGIGGDPAALRSEHLRDAARQGDPEALAVLDQFAWWTALGMVNLTNLLDPEVIVMGGGLADMADLVEAPIRRHFGDLLYAPEHRPHPRFAVARFGGSAGAIGAALLPGLP